MNAKTQKLTQIQSIMKRFLLMSVGLIIATVFLILSCTKKDSSDSPGSTTVDQDKENMEASMDGIIACATELKNGDAAYAVKLFLKMSGGEALSEEWVDEILDQLDVQFNFEQIEDLGRFDFPFYCGTYTWNNIGWVWQYTALPSDKIILEFPSQENGSSNNAILTLHSYTDEYLHFDDEAYWFPKTVYANLTLDGEEIAWVTADNIQYDIGNFQIPVTASCQAYVKPFTFSVEYSRETPTRFAFDVGYTNGSSCIMNVNVKAQIKHSDYENLDLEDDLTILEGSFQHGNMMIKFYGDIGTLNQLEDPTPAQVNELLSAEVYMYGLKVGELEYREYDDEVEIYIIYKDGSSENTSRYYEDLLDRLEMIAYDFTGEWDLDF